MCGFAGLLSSFDLSPTTWEDGLKSMGEAIQHRGPDGEGIWFDHHEGIGLSHRRLAVIDVSQAGHQPMISSNEKEVIVYNGEIYNAPELSEALKKEGVQLKSHCDTEMLLEACGHWGLDNTLQKLSGMFSFALWNRESKTLKLARDRMGIKPLYYGFHPQGFFFASELHALRAWPGFKADLDRDALSLYMRHNYIPAPKTVYQSIYKLMPGHSLELKPSETKQAKVHCYWNAKDTWLRQQEQSFKGSYEQAVDILEDKLMNSVKRHMLSDVPLGCFLSGGIDSSLVSALAQKISPHSMETFTIGFGDQDYNESRYAAEVAKHLGCDHQALTLSADDMLNAIPEILQSCDEPFADSSQIPTWFVSRMTRNKVTVALSGDGGDELFCGYNRYLWGETLWKNLSRLPPWLRKVMAKSIRTMSPDTWCRFHELFKWMLPKRFHQWHFGQKLHRFSYSLMSSEVKDLYRIIVSHVQDPEEAVLHARLPESTIDRDDLWSIPSSAPEKMMLVDSLTYMPDDILTKVDRASMLVSLESRVPLLDPEVIDFAWSLPQSYKLKQMVTKRILRDVLYRHVPRFLIDRPKMGFAIPLDQWLRGRLKPWAEDLLSRERIEKESVLNADYVEAKWKAHQSGKEDWSSFLWNVIVFQNWLSRP